MFSSHHASILYNTQTCHHTTRDAGGSSGGGMHQYDSNTHYYIMLRATAAVKTITQLVQLYPYFFYSWTSLFHNIKV